jgi:ABC-type multidrug transport system ATPase subunit
MAVTDTEALLELRQLKVWRGARVVLRDADLTVGAGDVVVLVGANGAGKSTLIEVAASILPVTIGTVLRGGIVTNDSQGRRKRGPLFGLCLQQDALCGDELVAERISSVMRISGKEVDLSWMLGLLGEWGLRHRAADRIAWLSGGMRRRVALLSALIPALTASEPRLLLLDEPSEGLDDQSAELLCRSIKSLAAAGHGFVIASHDQRLRRIATSVIGIDAQGGLGPVSGGVGEQASGSGGEQSSGSGGEQASRGESVGSDAVLRVETDARNPVQSNAATVEGAAEATPVQSGGLQKATSEQLELKASDLSLWRESLNWYRLLERRTKANSITRGIPALMALILMMGIASDGRATDLSANWLAALVLLPGFIAAMIPPAELRWHEEQRSAAWWKAMVDRPLLLTSVFTGARSTLFIALICSYGAWWWVGSGAALLNQWLWLLGGVSMALVSIGAASIHSMLEGMARRRATFSTLLTLILAWSFMLLSSAVADLIEGQPFSSSTLISIAAAGAIPLIIWFVVMTLGDD